MTKSNLTLELDTSNLNELQVRLLKRAMALLDHVSHVDEEAEYFEASSELLRVVAQVIKFSNFNKGDSEIEMADQALEFCVDRLADQIYTKDLVKFDCQLFSRSFNI